MLTSLIKKNKLEKYVKFYNKYVTLDEIISYLKASDIYISSGANMNQITSGTLAYAMGCGRSVVSTPFLHAIDALTQDKGILVDMEDKDSFKKNILYLPFLPIVFFLVHFSYGLGMLISLLERK